MAPEHLRRALAGHDGPVAVIDRDALDRNIKAMADRACGLPIRVASKSVRVPEAMRRVLAAEGYRGVLAFVLPEALALFEDGFEDLLVAYPSTDRAALRTLAADPRAREQIALTVDCVEHLDLIEQAVGEDLLIGPPIRLSLDLDMSLHPTGDFLLDATSVGAWRSPVRTPEQAAALARAVLARPGFRLVGLMGYEAQIAGMPASSKSVTDRVMRRLQKRSVAEMAERRPQLVAAVREVSEPEFVNGGGTGSIESSAAEGSLTEIGAGSGLLSPALFDGYARFRHEPAAFFAVPVVRRPRAGWVTVQGGGFVASGPALPSRLPTIDWPEGLDYHRWEGAGEVQTPLRGPGADSLSIGDLVWFRHAKGGELAEHFTEYLVVSDGEIVDRWPTYRGRGGAF